MKLGATLLFALSGALVGLPALAQVQSPAPQLDGPFYCSANTNVREMTKACGAHVPALSLRAEEAYASWYRRNKLKSKARAERCDTHLKQSAQNPAELALARRTMKGQIKSSYTQFSAKVAQSPEPMCSQMLEQVETPGGKFDLN